ncbi:nitroreductase family protein [Psychrobacter pygoscelis]|uniref:nitroreductase family protein n=1 Tax=Psychrobacter pygoscelis TaxID=2488563 RepID=UPI0010396B9E|nr:nitroreductase family protein [Psychrobacter pygoscelis]
MNLAALLNQRTAYYDYDANESVDRQTIEQLVTEAMKAPSAYHLQNWYFIAVTTPEHKNKLCQVAYEQRQILSAAVTFIVCGDMDGYKRLPAALQPSIDMGTLPQILATSFIEGINNSHPNNPQLRRDEAIRSASLASMVLMLTAESKGFATGPMSGFDITALQEAFDLPEYLLPVMLVTVGTTTVPRFPSKQRLPVVDKLTIL